MYQKYNHPQYIYTIDIMILIVFLFTVVKKIFVIQVFRYENFHLGENGETICCG